MKVNIGYLNCYDSILGPNLIKIFITPNIKCVFFKKTFFHNNSKFCILLCKNANCKSATCNRVQLQDRLAGHSLLGDDISLRIGLVVGIFAIVNLIVFLEFS